METGEQFFISVKLDSSFKKIRALANKHKNDIADMVNYLCAQSSLTDKQEKELQKGISLWAITTQSFAMMEEKLPLDKFSTLIIFYRGLPGDVYIRQVCFPVKGDKLETPKAIFEYANYGYGIDKQNHPERFYESAEIVDIRSKK